AAQGPRLGGAIRTPPGRLVVPPADGGKVAVVAVAVRQNEKFLAFDALHKGSDRIGNGSSSFPGHRRDLERRTGDWRPPLRCQVQKLHFRRSSQGGNRHGTIQGRLELQSTDSRQQEISFLPAHLNPLLELIIDDADGRWNGSDVDSIQFPPDFQLYGPEWHEPVDLC